MQGAYPERASLRFSGAAVVRGVGLFNTPGLVAGKTMSGKDLFPTDLNNNSEGRYGGQPNELKGNPLWWS
jgi:hypothetical protein